MSCSVASAIFLTPEELAADCALESAHGTLLNEAIQRVKDLVGPGVTVTISNEFGASVVH